MEKNVIFVPGYKQHCDDYPHTMERLAANGHVVFPIELDWSDKATPHRWGNQIGEQIKDWHIQAGATIIGHSFGAAAVAVEVGRNPERYDNVVLCSLPPIGKEDLSQDIEAREYYENNTPRVRYEGFASFPLNMLLKRARQVPARSVFIGGKEAKQHAFMERRAKSAAHMLGTSVVAIVDAPHFMDYDPNYVEAVAAQV